MFVQANRTCRSQYERGSIVVVLTLRRQQDPSPPLRDGSHRGAGLAGRARRCEHVQYTQLMAEPTHRVADKNWSQRIVILIYYLLVESNYLLFSCS